MKANIERGQRAIALDPEGEIAGTANLNMNLYEMNQQFMASQEPLPVKELEQAIKDVILDYTFNMIGNACENKHFMLLCKDINYYTIFEYSEGAESIISAFLDCIKNVGQVLSIEYNKTNFTPEIWVRTPDYENICMYYFNCENLVVPFGG